VPDSPSHNHSDNSEESASTKPPDAEFIKEFTRHQRQVFLYILSQVSNPLEAEEILQETNLVIWNKCDQFTPGTNFKAWACQIARYEVLKHLERHRRDRHYFNDELIEQIAQESFDESLEWEFRREGLAHCMQKLKAKDRELIQKRYAPGKNGRTAADDLGRPMNSVYQSLSRIRRNLMECIQRYLATAEAES
jgi:RNA polymerase sigma-70 factor, ECF subfamily